MKSHFRKGQVLIEFMMFLGISMTIFVVVTAILYTQWSQIEEQTRASVLRDFASSIQDDFFIASTMYNGFHRTIVLPEYLGNNNYSIQITNSNLFVSENEFELILPLPQVSGTISGDTITIEQTSGGLVIS